MTCRATGACIAATALLTLTGCAGESSGPLPGLSSAPGVPAGTVTAPKLPHSGAPPVRNPLPRTVLDGDPCVDALTPAQVRVGLGVAVTGERGDLASVGPACSWTNPKSLAQVSVGYTTETKQGLSGVYQNTKPKAKVWKELTIQGFPAAASVTSAAEDDFCGISVGLADDFSIDVAVFISASKIGTLNPCDAATTAAEMAVTTLKEKAAA